MLIEIDYYELLEVSKGSDKSTIKKYLYVC